MKQTNKQKTEIKLKENIIRKISFKKYFKSLTEKQFKKKKS